MFCGEPVAERRGSRSGADNAEGRVRNGNIRVVRLLGVGFRLRRRRSEIFRRNAPTLARLQETRRCACPPKVQPLYLGAAARLRLQSDQERRAPKNERVVRPRHLEPAGYMRQIRSFNVGPALRRRESVPWFPARRAPFPYYSSHEQLSSSEFLVHVHHLTHVAQHTAKNLNQ